MQFPGMSKNYAHAHAIFTRRYFSLDERLGTRLEGSSLASQPYFSRARRKTGEQKYGSLAGLFFMYMYHSLHHITDVLWYYMTTKGLASQPFSSAHGKNTAAFRG